MSNEIMIGRPSAAYRKKEDTDYVCEFIVNLRYIYKAVKMKNIDKQWRVLVYYKGTENYETFFFEKESEADDFMQRLENVWE